MSKLTDIYTQKILLREHGEETNGFQTQSEEKCEVRIGNGILELLNSIWDSANDKDQIQEKLVKIQGLADELLKIHGIQ